MEEDNDDIQVSFDEESQYDEKSEDSSAEVPMKELPFTQKTVFSTPVPSVDDREDLRSPRQRRKSHRRRRMIDRNAAYDPEDPAYDGMANTPENTPLRRRVVAAHYERQWPPSAFFGMACNYLKDMETGRYKEELVNLIVSMNDLNGSLFSNCDNVHLFRRSYDEHSMRYPSIGHWLLVFGISTNGTLRGRYRGMIRRLNENMRCPVHSCI